tara:strand:- start:146 stop:274 length:129 start_codon:yes stop_codon:yes gene_type:complete
MNHTIQKTENDFEVEKNCFDEKEISSLAKTARDIKANTTCVG